MAKTVVGLMDNLDEAQAVVRDLVSAGIRREDIGFMANEKQAIPSSAALNESEGEAGGAASGALAGAGAGAAIGGLGGLLLSVAPLAIPGIGPIIAAGPIAAALAGAGIGAVAGGLIGGLTHLGVPEEEAHYYAEGVRRGGILVTVASGSEAQASQAVDIMKRHGAIDIDERATEWKRQGWKGRFEAQEQQRSVEEPVVEKRARVVEEVKVGKQKSRRKETVQDRVRRTDVDVQRTGSAARRGTYKGPERRVSTAPWLGEERRKAA